jgi:hypothetical protein
MVDDPRLRHSRQVVEPLAPDIQPRGEMNPSDALAPPHLPVLDPPGTALVRVSGVPPPELAPIPLAAPPALAPAPSVTGEPRPIVTTMNAPALLYNLSREHPRWFMGVTTLVALGAAIGACQGLGLVGKLVAWLAG